MYHPIEFTVPLTMDVEISRKHRLERVRVRAGTRMAVLVLPHMIETAEGPVESADLCLEDGCIVRDVRFEQFRFVD